MVHISDYSHAIAQPALTCRAHFRLLGIKFWLRGYTQMLIHLADTLDIIKVSAVEALVDLFLNDVELAAGLDVVFYGHGRRRRDDVRYLLAAFWIKHVDVEDVGSRVVPCCSWKGILGDILDFTEC